MRPLPSTEALHSAFGLHWNGTTEPLGGRFADVFRIRDQYTGTPYVLRISDADHISPDRVRTIHRFLEHVDAHSVHVALPLKTGAGDTLLTTADGHVIELAPYIAGRHPERGNVADAILVSRAISALHTAGVNYADLPDEESLDQNHVAIGRLKEYAAEATRKAAGTSLTVGLKVFCDDLARLSQKLDALRPDLVSTGLHLDTSPGNLIIDGNGATWFIDCAHALRGRRVFEVAITLYYHDLSSVAEVGSPERYQLIDAELEQAYMDAYQATVAPSWRDAESATLGIEFGLMLVAGVCYRVLEDTEERATADLEGFMALRDGLQSRYGGDLMHIDSLSDTQM